MSWFKVDDGFWSHPKTLALSTEAVALWVKAGAWSSQHLTDGFVPEHAILVFGVTGSAVFELVKVGYWHRDEARSGWVFHDWEEYQPSAEETKAKRAELSRKRSEAGRRGATNRWHPDGNDGKSDGKTDGKSMATGNGNAMAPSRPVPSPTTSNEVDNVQPKAARDYTSEFEEFWSRYPRKQGKADAYKAFKAARKKHEAKVLLDGARAYSLLNIGVEKSFLKLPAGWIRGERWDDEEIESADQGGMVVPFRQRETVKERFCPAHQGYPFIEGIGCLACNRDQETGTAF